MEFERVKETMVRSYEVSFAKSRRTFSWPLGIEVKSQVLWFGG